jgi:metal-responsive CopG/Arc/MetJ family transcriptional regulator
MYALLNYKRGVDMSRVTMSLNDDLLARIDSYAKSNFMARSSVVGFACNQFLMGVELQTLLVDITRAMQKIAETGVVNEAQQKQLDKFEMMCELFQNGAAQ